MRDPAPQGILRFHRPHPAWSSAPPRQPTTMNSADKIPRPLAPELIEKAWSGREAWRVFEIIAEFAESTERLIGIRPAISIFGSARVLPGHPYYELTEQIARQLSDA